jgi:penicillin-binding protein-related factor A (putative recombinase)
MRGWTLEAIRQNQLNAADGNEQVATRIRRKQAGKRANESGKTWEARLNDYHEGLLYRGKVLKVFRQYPTMEITRRGREIVYIAKGKGPCDFAVFFKNGLAGLFDAKSHKEKNAFTWPLKQAHQLAELRDLHSQSLGKCPAFALVDWYSVGEVRVHPIATIKDRTVYRTDGFLLHEINWLPVVLNLWKIK